MQQLKCDVCGGDLMMAADRQSSTCASCGTIYTIDVMRDMIKALQGVELKVQGVSTAQSLVDYAYSFINTNVNEAEAQFKEALKIDPQCWQAWKGLFDCSAANTNTLDWKKPGRHSHLYTEFNIMDGVGFVMGKISLENNSIFFNLAGGLYPYNHKYLNYFNSYICCGGVVYPIIFNLTTQEYERILEYWDISIELEKDDNGNPIYKKLKYTFQNYLENAVKFCPNAIQKLELKKMQSFYFEPHFDFIQRAIDIFCNEYILCEGINKRDCLPQKADLRRQSEDEIKRLEEVKRQEETNRRKDAEEKRKAAELELTVRQERQSQQWASQGLCRHCGGKLSIFSRKCKSCGRQN